MQRPLPNEYSPYFQRYIGLVKEGNFLDLLDQNTTAILHFFKDLPAEKHAYRYAEGKWSVKEVLMHMIDTERVMCYRALVVAREDHETVLYNMDENLYALHTDVSGRSMESLLDEFAAVRNATKVFFEHLPDQQSKLIGKANAHPVSPRALGYMIVGHALHHIAVLSERY